MSKTVDELKENYKPTPHPLRALMTEHGISGNDMMRYLDVRYGTLMDILNGNVRVPKKYRLEIDFVVSQLEAGRMIDIPRPVPYELREFFKDRGITQGMLANYLGLGLRSLTMMLSGRMKMTEANDKKLRELADKIRREENGEVE